MVHQEARGRAKCESVFRTQGIEDYKNIRYENSHLEDKDMNQDLVDKSK